MFFFQSAVAVVPGDCKVCIGEYSTGAVLVGTVDLACVQLLACPFVSGPRPTNANRVGNCGGKMLSDLAVVSVYFCLVQILRACVYRPYDLNFFTSCLPRRIPAICNPLINCITSSCTIRFLLCRLS